MLICVCLSSSIGLNTKRVIKEHTESNQTLSYYRSLKYFVLFLQFFGVCEKHRFLAPKELGGWWLGGGWLMVGWWMVVSPTGLIIRPKIASNELILGEPGY